MSCTGCCNMTIPDCISRNFLVISVIHQHASVNLRYRNYISAKNSVVIVPEDVYDNSPEVRRSLVTSNDSYELNPNYRQNLPRWEYIALKTGVFRLYPGTPIDVGPTYDSRLEDWYISTATAPKSVFIALDTSGTLLIFLNRLKFTG